jgi:hypothetical protein
MPTSTGRGATDAKWVPDRRLHLSHRWRLTDPVRTVLGRDCMTERHDGGARLTGSAVSQLSDRTPLIVESVTQLLGCAIPVALGHQLGHLVPVGVAVEHHADNGERPWRLVEGRSRVGQSQQLVAG